MKSIKKLFLGLLLLSSLSFVYSDDVQFYNPSFDCSKVKKDSVEHMICTDNILSRSDEILAKNYQYMLSSDIGKGTKLALKISQKKWIIKRNLCSTKDCIYEEYKQRINEICDYPVISGVHPICTYLEDKK
ncbi:lysozyme inhibitor LprI family protein [Aliarcobacter butzleri]|uniref:lysozyme inhibitor LprI family protein n=1 Tax=Aliarcobacter butzleri TaxID=28197 RepID=UPI0012612AD9|nr:lysozyme inhibitor LprI family protein [Aliarcobacter butzleri]MCG3682584.1 lysozyme inhibitor LprI family protein [Aliarcobacter butzleri]